MNDLYRMEDDQLLFIPTISTDGRNDTEIELTEISLIYGIFLKIMFCAITGFTFFTLAGSSPVNFSISQEGN